MLKTKTKKTYQVQSAVIRLYPVKRKALTLHLSAFFCVVLWPIVFQPRTHTDNTGQNLKTKNFFSPRKGRKNSKTEKSKFFFLPVFSVVQTYPATTSQCPPLAGPTRRSTPSFLSRDNCHSTPLGVIERSTANSSVVNLGFS